MKYAVHLSARSATDEGQDARSAIDVRQSGSSSLAINAPAIRLVTDRQFILLPPRGCVFAWRECLRSSLSGSCSCPQVIHFFESSMASTSGSARPSRETLCVQRVVLVLLYIASLSSCIVLIDVRYFFLSPLERHAELLHLKQSLSCTSLGAGRNRPSSSEKTRAPAAPGAQL